MPPTSKRTFKKFFGKIRNKNAKNFINFPLPTVCQDGETVLKALLPNSRIFWIDEKRGRFDKYPHLSFG